ncbi:MAG: rod-binding protein [Rhodospirillaceae bacterium]
MLDPAALLSQASDAYSAGTQNRVSGQASAKNAMTEEQARAAGKEFESFFIGQMLEYMNTDIDSGGMFGGGHAEDVWRSMLNQEYGKEMVKSGSIGIADAVMKSLIQSQNETSPVNATSSSAAAAAAATAAALPASAAKIPGAAGAPIAPISATASTIERVI